MIKKSITLIILLFLLTVGAAACGTGEDADVQPDSQTGTQEDMSEEQLKMEIQKMKDEGILDENGQPAPGVDLNDYPGLG